MEDGVILSEVVHDDKASVDSILAELGVHSSKDLWHKCKSFCAKFKDELTKAKRGVVSNLSEARCAQDLHSLTIPTLKEQLKAAGLDLKGKKDDLVQRLWTSLEREEETVEQDTCLLKYPELAKHHLADKLKTHVYTACFARAAANDDDVTALCLDLQNAADHWVGDHSVCDQISRLRKCVQEDWGAQQASYEKGGETHKAVKAWLVKKCTPAKMKFYTRARENFLSETFNSLINKYASKRIHYQKSHLARVACATLHWNEGRDRVVLMKKVRKAAGTAVRTRGANRNVLSEKTTKWKSLIAAKLGLSCISAFCSTCILLVESIVAIQQTVGGCEARLVCLKDGSIPSLVNLKHLFLQVSRQFWILQAFI
jgi:hypothetical protein